MLSNPNTTHLLNTLKRLPTINTINDDKVLSINRSDLKQLLDTLRAQNANVSANAKLIKVLLLPDSVRLCSNEFVYIYQLNPTKTEKNSNATGIGGAPGAQEHQCIPLKMLPNDILKKLQETQVVKFLTGQLSIIDLYSFTIAMSDVGKTPDKLLTTLLGTISSVCDVKLYFETPTNLITITKTTNAQSMLVVANYLKDHNNILRKIELHVRTNAGIPGSNLTASAKKVLVLVNIVKIAKDMKSILSNVRHGEQNVSTNIRRLESDLRSETTPSDALEPKKVERLASSIRTNLRAYDDELKELMKIPKNANGRVNASKSADLLSKASSMLEDLEYTKYLIQKFEELFATYLNAGVNSKAGAKFAIERLLEDPNEFMISEREES